MTLPISLYIHIPWCIKKCPYCDFNSHVSRQEIPENAYLNTLIDDFSQQRGCLQGRHIQTVFIGGGTPSLMSAQFYDTLLETIAPNLAPSAEITLEANPGTIDYQSNKFRDYRSAGINRLSLGIQSLDNHKLKYLGRMHSRESAIQAIELAKESGFERLNCDIMYGLTQQTIEDALGDLKTIIALEPSHLSWYQLTIEPNTYFHRRPPTLPEDDTIFDMQIAGQTLLASHGYHQYEVSAYAKNGDTCQHNLNYWLFGDYIGIGAGAHGKITYPHHNIIRSEQHKSPTYYMERYIDPTQTPVPKQQYLFEFLLNACRLKQKIPYQLIRERCGIDPTIAKTVLSRAINDKLIYEFGDSFQLSDRGLLFINDILVDVLAQCETEKHTSK